MALARYAEGLFGPDWARPLARLIGWHPRTVTRIKAAAKAGRDYPRAKDAMHALVRSVSAMDRRLKLYQSREDERDDRA